MTISEINEFDNSLSDLITETFSSKEELDKAIKYYGNKTIASILEEHKKWYVIEDDQDGNQHPP